MDIIEYEIRRYETWKAELEGTKPPSDDLFIIRKQCPTSTSMVEINKSRIPEPLRPRSGNFNDVNYKAAMEGSIYDDLTNSTDSLDDKKLSDEEKVKRYRTLIKKQEQLLRVTFYLLLNMAEDQSIEEKMTKKNIIVFLVKTLDRDNTDLLLLVVTFLKKLSLMQSNKDEMAQLNVVDKLPKLLQSNNADLVHLTLKLLFNLSFDKDLRSKMVKNDFLSKFVSLLSKEKVVRKCENETC